MSVLAWIERRTWPELTSLWLEPPTLAPPEAPAIIPLCISLACFLVAFTYYIHYARLSPVDFVAVTGRASPVIMFQVNPSFPTSALRATCTHRLEFTSGSAAQSTRASPRSKPGNEPPRNPFRDRTPRADNRIVPLTDSEAAVP